MFSSVQLHIALGGSTRASCTAAAIDAVINMKEHKLVNGTDRARRQGEVKHEKANLFHFY